MKFEKIEALALAFTAALSILLCGATVMSIVVLAGLLSGFAVVPLHGQTRPAVELEAAMTKERVDGDLKTAVAAYQKIAADKSAPRDVRAKALLHLAGCYEKLGQQAQSVYQQIVRDFADQPAAVQARSRLAALKQDDHLAAPVTLTQRRIDIAGASSIQSDGQRAIYVDDALNAVIAGDPAGKNKRVVFRAKPGEWLICMASRDLKMVYLRVSAPGGSVTHAVIRSNGTGYRELFQGYPYGSGWPVWSWDDRYLVFGAIPPGPEGASVNERSGLAVGGGVAVISVSDGKGREVARHNASIWAGAISPDGRFIAFSESVFPGDPSAKAFIVPVQGGEPQLVSDDASVLDWTGDGRYLAVSSTRSGSMALWLLPMKDGQPSGDPVFVHNGSFIFGGTTFSNGALQYSSIRTGTGVAAVATLDPDGRLREWKPLDLKIAGTSASGAMSWSPDGTQIAYSSAHDDAGQQGAEMRVRNIVSGEDRGIYRNNARVTMCSWETKRPYLLCNELAPPSWDVVSVALESGSASRLGHFDASQFDGISSGGPSEQLKRERGIETLDDVVENYGPRALVRVVEGHDLQMRATPAGDWKHLASLTEDRKIFYGSRTADNKWIFYADKDSTGQEILFRVPSAGGQPERLGEIPAQFRSNIIAHVSPDGRKVLMEGAGDSGIEAWVLENFAPLAPKH